MNAPFDPNRTGPGRFAIGQPVPRTEDPVLLRGEGRYTDDLHEAGQAYGVMVRSPVAHGTLGPLDLGAARSMPGVLAIVTQAELEAGGIGRMAAPQATGRGGASIRKPPQTPLATTRVRYVGEPIAMVVAETQAAARDAAEAILPAIETLPAVTSASEAAQPGAPLLHDEAPGNVALDYHYGDSEAVAAAFAKAAHVTKLALRNSRVVVAPLEPRAAIASHDPATDRYTLRLGCQGVFGMRNSLAAVMGVKPAQVRVLTGNVGGSFGMKASVYPEYLCLLVAARTLGRPVRWADTRSESFLSDSHGRDHEMECELALDADGRFLALRVTGFGNLGAHLGNATVIPSTANTVKNIIGVYRTPLVEVSAKCVFTNTTPVGAYRGAGRPEGNYYMERLVDTAAREMGIDRIELRRRNHIPREPMPYQAPSGMLYDSGEFRSLLDRAVEAADWQGFAARRAESKARGRLRGLGIGQYLEVTAPQGAEMGGVRFDEDGGVTIITGTLDYGQGHAAPFAQVLADRLGVPFEKIRLLQGDSDELVAGGGTGGSRSIMQSGAALAEASRMVIERGTMLAAHFLEASAGDIEFASGRYSIVGTDRGVGLLELAAKLRTTKDLPGDLPDTLDVRHAFQGVVSAFPNGCHIAEVEVDPETGTTELVRYASVNDFGVLVNPLLVEGQTHGGIAQGLGQALHESVAYDETGQLLSGSFMDYALPRASDLPNLGFESHPVPARTNPLGVKGCGEAGCAGSLPAVMNALVDALSEYGIAHIDMPATPERVWRAIDEARRTA